FAGYRTLYLKVLVGSQRLGKARLRQIDQVEDEIGRAHLGHAAVGRFGADETAIFRQFVDRLTTAANAEILAALSAEFDTRADIGPHLVEYRAVEKVDQAIPVDIAEDEVAVIGIAQSEQFRREGRNIARPVHAGDRKRLDQLIEEHRFLWAQ